MDTADKIPLKTILLKKSQVVAVKRAEGAPVEKNSVLSESYEVNVECSSETITVSVFTAQ